MNPVPQPLTAAEARIVEVLTESPVPRSYEEIARRVGWATTPGAIRKHVWNVRRKLGAGAIERLPVPFEEQPAPPRTGRPQCRYRFAADDSERVELVPQFWSPDLLAHIRSGGVVVWGDGRGTHGGGE